MKYVTRMNEKGWTEKSRVTFRIACCDCGLVHDMVLVAGRKGTPIGIAARRNERATAAKRRKGKKK